VTKDSLILHKLRSLSSAPFRQNSPFICYMPHFFVFHLCNYLGYFCPVGSLRSLRHQYRCHMFKSACRFKLVKNKNQRSETFHFENCNYLMQLNGTNICFCFMVIIHIAVWGLVAFELKFLISIPRLLIIIYSFTA
jgi:hypothetical protein